ncbi:MAG: protease complex subunit PrcB family protein [Planctomycetota bacterium]|nr:protease complex subunit PrcB family protein [Planctomycetota bacterium]
MKTIAFMLAAAAAIGCKSADSAGADVAFRSLARGYQSGLSEPGVRVARNETEWHALWARHASLVMPRPDAPTVDFAHDMVIYVSIGTRPTYGYAVGIDRVTAVDAAHLRIEITEKKPASDAITSQIVTQPYHMIVTSNRTGDVELVTLRN